MVQTAPRALRHPLSRVSRVATAADVITAVLLLLTVSAAVTGGFRAEVLGARLSVTSWWRTALVAAAVLALRHWWQPSPSLYARAVQGWRTWRVDPVTRGTWPVVVATRVGVLVVGLMAVYAVGYPEGRAPIRVAEGEVGLQAFDINHG